MVEQALDKVYSVGDQLPR